MKRIIRKVGKKFLRSADMFCYMASKPFLSRKVELPMQEAEKLLTDRSPDPATSPLCENKIELPDCDLTIIVPAYNVQEYIGPCLESVFCQKTKYHYRVVVINDGSTDNTGAILKAYGDNEKLVVIEQENRGFSGARNRGLERICSKYIMFLDSDDLLVDGAVEKMLSVAYESDADVLQGGYEMVVDGSMKVINTVRYRNKESVQPIGLFPGMPWGKIYKASLFENVHFPEKYWYEDTIMTSLIYPFAKKAGTISDLVYKYRVRSTGITQSSFGKPKALDSFWVTRCVLSARKELGLQTDCVYYQALIRQIVLNYKRTAAENEEIKQSIFVLTRAMLKSHKTDKMKIQDRRLAEIEKALLEGYYDRYKKLCKMI